GGAAPRGGQDRLALLLDHLPGRRVGQLGRDRRGRPGRTAADPQVIADTRGRGQQNGGREDDALHGGSLEAEDRGTRIEGPTGSANNYQRFPRAPSCAGRVNKLSCVWPENGLRSVRLSEAERQGLRSPVP